MASGDDDDAVYEDASSLVCTHPVPTKPHPFFMPLSAKRAHSSALPICADSIDLSMSEAQSKRLKQKDRLDQLSTEKQGRVGRSKGSIMPHGSGALGSGLPKASKIHSFFTVRSSQPSTLAPAAQPDGPHPEPTCVAAEIAEEATEVGSKTPAPQRPLFRPAGIPAPLPTEYTHVPFPVYRTFEAPDCPRNAGRCSAEVINGAIKRAAERELMLHAAHGWCSSTSEDNESADGGCTQWRHGIGSSSSGGNDASIWQHLNRHLPDSVTAQSADRARIRATPARVLLGRHLPPTPAHLQFTEPLLHLLCHQAPVVEGQRPLQLLSSRYRPRRARDVLDNQRAVLQLHSWIESMRLRRPAPVAATAPGGSDEFCTGQGSKRGARRIPPKAAQCWRSKPRRTVGDDSTSETGQSSQPASEGDTSDDFMPQSRRPARRRVGQAGELGDVLAWAQSNGTLSSVRERSYTVSRHSRRGSSGGSGSESESFSNVILLTGPSGSCKTAAVYACAEESGFGVHEIHPGQRRSGKDVLALLEDVILSHTITAQAGNPSLASNGAVNQMLILIEQVDVLFEQDQRLWPALKQLALKSRRPIVLTCSSLACVRWETTCFHAVLQFTRPSESSLVPYCFLLCLAEGVLAAPTDLARACRKSERDINRLLCLLEILIMQTSTMELEVPDAPGCLTSDDGRQKLDLGGTLAWLLNPLENGETPQSRYSFWSELIASVHREDSQRWFGLWPDPPPLLYDKQPAVAKPRVPAVHQDDFFTQPYPVAVDTPELCAETEQLALSSLPHNSPPTLCISVPLSASDSAPQATSANSLSAIALGAASAERDPLDTIVDALDTLSLACVTTSATELRTECQREPLYTFMAPLHDGCLDVNYLTLDLDILTRHNVTLLPDSANVDQSTRVAVGTYLHASSLARLESVAGTESLRRGIESSMKIRGVARPISPSAQPTEGSLVQLRLQRAFELAEVRSQRCTLPVLLETCSYVAQMISWDHMHQGKARPALATLGSSDGLEHTYRFGTRRTRQNTYRPHVKAIPDRMHEFLLSWISFGKQVDRHI
ncbi:hypothetical protein IWW37_002443 [Coemansia sp. RSA 2050]|nr:hypothetical protein IWW37_002443 [Coemansia sp. RSA 2050]KAJ2736418.1 hypothetical protein IW152_000779 [Coemansia sp. BCRC 34962]